MKNGMSKKALGSNTLNEKIEESDLNEDDDRQEVKIASMMALQIGVRTFYTCIALPFDYMVKSHLCPID